MAGIDVAGRFADERVADMAQRTLDREGLAYRVTAAPGELAQRETRFMGRIVILVALWSVFGTATGAGLGVLISTIFGPHGTDGLIIQAVSWAIFAHLLVGMWAGYWLLADRSRQDLPIPGGCAVLLVVECASIDDTIAVADRLRKLGASDVSNNTPVAGRQGGRDGEQV